MLDLVESIHKTAVDKGFWDFLIELDKMLDDGDITSQEYDELSFIFYGKQLMMLSSEVAEAMEAIRKDKGQGEIEAEFADIYIRTVDLYYGLRDRGLVSSHLDEAVARKANMNTSRERMHGVRG